MSCPSPEHPTITMASCGALHQSRCVQPPAPANITIPCAALWYDIRQCAIALGDPLRRGDWVSPGALSGLSPTTSQPPGTARTAPPPGRGRGSHTAARRPRGGPGTAEPRPRVTMARQGRGRGGNNTGATSQQACPLYCADRVRTQIPHGTEYVSQTN